MFEMYGFIAAFTAQILLFSVAGPLRVIGSLRGQIAQFVAERAPPIDAAAVSRVDRRLQRLRLLALGTALIGLLLLILMIRYMLRPDWTDGPLEAAVPVYFVIQCLPTLLAVVTASQFHAVLKHALPQEKRKALLQPRGLFDFVSRTAVGLAVLTYFLFIGFLAYVQRHPFPGFAGLLTNAVAVTLIYAAVAFAIFLTVRTMGSSPLQAREERMRSVGVAVKVCVYSCIVCVVFIALLMTLTLLDQQRWEPTFVSLSVVVTGLLTGMSLRQNSRIAASADSAAAALTP